MIEGYRKPEGARTPEYWDGHSFKDNCGWKEWGVDWPEDANLRALRRENGEAERFAEELLSAYVGMPLPFPIRSFESGEQFDASQFPPGTIIRYVEEKSAPDMPRYSRFSHLGVIYPVSEDSRAKKGRVVVHVREGSFKRGEREFARLTAGYSLANLTVGEVDHYRLVYGGLFNRLGRSRVQHISRVTQIQILEYGEGVPVRAEERRRATSLAPQTS